MKKAQTQTAKTGSSLTLNSSGSKFKEENKALKDELIKKNKQYNDDIVRYNLKINELEEIVEKKDAEYSDEILKLHVKISELEDSLCQSKERDVKIKKELDYRASKLDEYEMKIYKSEEIIEDLTSQLEIKWKNMEQNLVAVQNSVEKKSDCTLEYLRNIIIILKTNDTKSREADPKTPAAMETLIKLLQNSDQNCRKLQAQKTKLEEQADVLKTVLYNNIISRYNLDMFIAEMFARAVHGLIIDLNAVLPYLTLRSIPSNNECITHVEHLKVDHVKYIGIIDDLKIYKGRIDEYFAVDKINNIRLDNIPQIKNLHIPVSILHISYLPMLINFSRFQNNQINALQTQQFAYQQHIRGAPIYWQPNMQNVPMQVHLRPQTSLSTTITIEDVSSQNDTNCSKCINQENNTQNNNELVTCLDEDNKSDHIYETEEIVDEDYNLKIELIDNDRENEPSREFETKIDSIIQNIKPFKLISKNKMIVDKLLNVFHEKTTNSLKSHNDDDDDNSIATIECIDAESSITDFEINHTISNNNYSQTEPDKHCLAQEPSEIVDLLSRNNSETISDSHLSEINNTPSSNNLTTSDNYLSNEQLDVFKDVHIDSSSINASVDVMENIEEVHNNAVDRLEGSNSLVKFYFYARDKIKLDLLNNATDDQLVDAILAVKKENTIKGMRKKDILTLVLDFIKKQKEVEASKKSFCAICFGSNDNEPSKTLPCNHQFHINCLQQWFERDNICPVCRNLVVAVDDLT